MKVTCERFFSLKKLKFVLNIEAKTFILWKKCDFSQSTKMIFVHPKCGIILVLSNNSLKGLIMSALYREQSIKEAKKKMSDEFIEEAIKKSPILLS